MGTADSFPLDIEGAEKEGLADWRGRFFWPLSHDCALEVEGAVKAVLNEMIAENVAGVGRELLLINYKLFFAFTNLINSLRVLNSLKALGLQPVLGGHSQHYRGLLKTGAPLEFRISPPILPTTTRFRLFKQRLGFRKRLLLCDFSAAALVGGLASRRAPLAFSPNPLALEYLATALKGKVRWLDLRGWAPEVQRHRVSTSQRAALRSLAEELLRRVDVIAVQSEVILTECHRRFLFEGTLELLKETLKWSHVVRARLASRPAAPLFVGSSGGLLTRVLSLAVQGQGGCVTGFMHGEPLIHDSRKYSWLELSTVGRFMTFTDHSAAILRSLSATYPSPGSTSVKIEGVNTKSFRVFRERETRKPRPLRIRRVMLVANTFEPVEKEGLMSFPELMQLDWELRILEALRKAGFQPVYKQHPDGKLRGREVHIIDGVEVVHDRFENVMDAADAFVFYHTTTSALGPALCTNKPIVYIDAGWEKWIPQVRQAFSKRCRIVPAFFDDRNRLLFDPKALSEALRPADRDPDEEILRYMI